MAVTPWHFVLLKLRVMRNGLRGQRWRIALFVIGLFFGAWFSVVGFTLFAVTGFSRGHTGMALGGGLGGAAVVLGWLLMPLVFFGVDETLDPARFALLPLRRRTLVSGMFAAALAGVPALATLAATSGLAVAAALHGGAAAGLVQLAGVVAGLLLCVSLSRATTSAFSAMLRSRRVRDLAAILLAVLAALLGPLQIGLLAAARTADWDVLAGVARVLGWTPLAAPYTVGLDVVEGRWLAVPAKFLIMGVSVAVLLWWWSATLESAMVGTATTTSGRGTRETPDASPTTRLFPRLLRGLPRNRFGALVALQVRYWWRDTRRRANLITFAVVGMFVPLMVNIGSRGLIEGTSAVPPSLATATASMVFLGVLGGVGLANQFGYDGTAYAANVVAGVPGTAELRSRVAGFSCYLVPLIMAIPVALALVLHRPGWIPSMWGATVAAYGCGVAINLFVSVLGAFSLPETSNPFAVNTGAGVTKSLFSFAAMLCTLLLCVPVFAVSTLASDVWVWAGLPAGLLYGGVALWLGSGFAGRLLDRRMPELLSAISPRR
ncbi:ABC-2 type transport system permease protein [Catenuloplanes nepalensis]|uniref:ABC-2 type transport system permease protein n=1 Tax=Catenuloplanes nepalensis TaxID=587533 RepID=A0ABT9N4G5_9ACTN|nr:ABC transporter permease [Catenuloplanes nepalensis]MDP9798593.1 ABC-2 type transport system permease protein [Catenuloplanes nepalensis]